MGRCDFSSSKGTMDIAQPQLQVLFCMLHTGAKSDTYTHTHTKHHTTHTLSHGFRGTPSMCLRCACRNRDSCGGRGNARRRAAGLRQSTSTPWGKHLHVCVADVPPGSRRLDHATRTT
jgi:hypothetical protein